MLICSSICTSFISLVYFPVTVKKELSLISRALRSRQHRISVSKKLSVTLGVLQDDTKMPVNDGLGFCLLSPKGGYYCLHLHLLCLLYHAVYIR